MRTVLLALLCSSTAVVAQNAPSLQFRGAQPLSKHAAINTPPVTAAMASGEKVSLVVEMTPHPGKPLPHFRESLPHLRGVGFDQSS